MSHTRNRTRAILIVDSDLDYFSTLAEQQTSKRLPIIMASNASEADTIIANSEWNFTGIFVNPAAAEPGGIAVFRSAFKHRPATPVYLLTEQGKPQLLVEEDLRRLGVKHTLEKETLGYDQLLELANPVSLSEQVQEAVKKAEVALVPPGDTVDGRTVDEKSVEGDQNFISIRAEDFLGTGQTIFDVFVRIAPGKYICLVKAGDGLSIEQLEKYLMKGVTRFYLRKEIHTQYLALCDHLTTTLLKELEVSLEVKASQTMLQGEETLNFLKDRGISDENLRYASSFVTNVCTLVDQVKLSRLDVFRDFMSHVASYDHAVGTTILGSILASTLEVALEDPIETVGISCLLHDIGLLRIPQDLWHEDEAKMTSIEQELFRTHAHVGSEMIKQMHGVHPAVAQAVEFHHLRIDPDNYGVKRAFTARHRLAEIVEISSEFNRLILLAKIDPKLRLLEYLEKKVFPCFTKQVVYAFRSAFFPSQKLKSIA